VQGLNLRPLPCEGGERSRTLSLEHIAAPKVRVYASPLAKPPNGRDKAQAVDSGWGDAEAVCRICAVEMMEHLGSPWCDIGLEQRQASQAID
jgi:hypothetical protein